MLLELELSFWEHATNGTVEMLDLLLFSYVVRSLLEYRIDLREGRLFRAAFVFGVGITSNHAMIAFLSNSPRGGRELSIVRTCSASA